jgi:hypothetical protein
VGRMEIYVVLKHVVYTATTVLYKFKLNGKSKSSPTVNTRFTLSSEVFCVRDRGKR